MATAGSAKVNLPETPLVLAGALGGPFCVFLMTPLRNALTLGSQDTASSALDLYGSVFSGSFTGGWTGGLAPVLPACGQFCVIGPLFHFLKETLGGVLLAVCCCALAETLMTYGSQTLNAQLAFNQLQGLEGGQVPLCNPLLPFGPGFCVHVIRNIVALSGMRVFSGPCQAGLSRAAAACGLGETPAGLRSFLGDFIGSLGAAVLSAPLHQCYNFAVTSEAYIFASPADRLHILRGFLARAYFELGPEGEVVGVTATLARDLLMRCAYVATLFALFGVIERTAVLFWHADRRRPLVERRCTVGVKASS